MQKVVVLGAGKSSGVLIKYLANQENLEVLVADASQENIQSKTREFPHLATFCGDLNDIRVLSSLINGADITVSLLPPFMHLSVAKICLEKRKHLLTASYASPEMMSLHEEVKKAGILILMECGLDPGIDHMSAMQLLDDIKEKGGEVVSFRSYCGGLVAPESDTNPWGYKVTWNPRNVVLAGQGTAQFLEDGRIKYVPYSQLFKRTSPLFFEDYGDYEAYPNRDSLSYISLYGLEKAKDFVRGTIRKKGYCEAWHYLVQLGLTDDILKVGKASSLSMKELSRSFVPDNVSLSQYLGVSEESEAYKRLVWLGILEEDLLFKEELKEASPAEFLQKLIEKKWKLEEGDKDMVLMQHLIEYKLDTMVFKLTSTLSVVGEEQNTTAMAKTVGLPLAIATLLLSKNEINITGVQRPVTQEIYKPILKSLNSEGIIFREKVYS